jgi:hypothetical protein
VTLCLDLTCGTCMRVMRASFANRSRAFDKDENRRFEKRNDRPLYICTYSRLSKAKTRIGANAWKQREIR